MLLTRVESYLGDSVLNHLLVRHIALVADEQLVDTLGGISVNLLKPLLDVVERVHVGNIVDNANAVSTAVVGGGDGTETLLAGGIPLSHRVSACKEGVRGRISSLGIAYDLQLDGLAIEFDRSDFLCHSQLRIR